MPFPHDGETLMRSNHVKSDGVCWKKSRRARTIVFGTALVHMRKTGPRSEQRLPVDVDQADGGKLQAWSEMRILIS